MEADDVEHSFRPEWLSNINNNAEQICRPSLTIEIAALAAHGNLRRCLFFWWGTGEGWGHTRRSVQLNVINETFYKATGISAGPTYQTLLCSFDSMGNLS